VGRVSTTVSICPDSPAVDTCKALERIVRMVNGISAVNTIPAVVTRAQANGSVCLGPEHGAGRNCKQQELGIVGPVIGDENGDRRDCR